RHAAARDLGLQNSERDRPRGARSHPRRGRQANPRGHAQRPRPSAGACREFSAFAGGAVPLALIRSGWRGRASLHSFGRARSVCWLWIFRWLSSPLGGGGAPRGLLGAAGGGTFAVSARGGVATP